MINSSIVTTLSLEMVALQSSDSSVLVIYHFYLPISAENYQPLVLELILACCEDINLFGCYEIDGFGRYISNYCWLARVDHTIGDGNYELMEQAE